jgi:hypothetical protein
MVLRHSKPDRMAPCRANAQNMFFHATLGILMKLNRGAGSGAAANSPGFENHGIDRTGFPKPMLTEDANVFEQPVVQRGQVLSQTPALQKIPQYVEDGQRQALAGLPVDKGR